MAVGAATAAPIGLRDEWGAGAKLGDVADVAAVVAGVVTRTAGWRRRLGASQEHLSTKRAV